VNPISQIRIATWADRDALRTLQHAAMRKLARPYYESDVIEAFIANVGTMDDALLDDGTYYVIHVGGMLAACGGWTLRTPGDMVHTVDEAMSPVRPVPTVRSMFVDPAFARRGLARRIMTRVETDLVCGGHARVSLTATLSGLPLYRGLGYRSLEPVVLSMPDDLKFIGIRMEKRLVQAELAALSSAA
jgi:GNAT superfamily N-acetyltransferase